MRGNYSKIVVLMISILLCPCLMLEAYAQGVTTGSINGTVKDPQGALIPGVTITATNAGTGVITTTVTNESGAYTFPSLQPGVYRLSAELPGFQTSRVNNLELGPIAVRQNFQLNVSTAQQSVEVTAEPLTAISQSSATVGDVLSQKKVSDLPIVGNNVLSVLDTMPGLRVSTSSAPVQMDAPCFRRSLVPSARGSSGEPGTAKTCRF